MPVDGGHFSQLDLIMVVVFNSSDVTSEIVEDEWERGWHFRFANDFIPSISSKSSDAISLANYNLEWLPFVLKYLGENCLRQMLLVHFFASRTGMELICTKSTKHQSYVFPFSSRKGSRALVIHTNGTENFSRFDESRKKLVIPQMVFFFWKMPSRWTVLFSSESYSPGFQCQYKW